MSKRFAVPVLLIIVLVGAVIFLNQSPQEQLNDDSEFPTTPTETWGETEAPVDPEPQPGEEQLGALRGVSLSPEAYTSDEFLAFFRIASESGDFVSWVGDVAFLASTDSPVTVLHSLESQFGYETIVIASHFDQSTGEVLHETNRQFIIDAVTGYVSEYNPEYLGFGVEVNAFYRTNPEGYEEFVPFYDDVYRAVKEANPETKIFTVFQLEHMKGLDGGLFGGVNDPEANMWDMLDDFQFDLAVFTTYPCLIYKDPSEIPQDYYTEITDYTSKPIAFSEMGWLKEGYPGWESSVEEQVEFIEFFFTATEELEMVFVTWSFLYDQEVQEPFDQMGLLSAGEETSIALEAWAMR